MNAKQKVACTITCIAGTFWIIDAASKYWALHNLVDHPTKIIPHFLFLILGTNYGGSFGIPKEYIEFCLTLPAALMFLTALWINRQLRDGKHISLVQQIGLGIFLGGALANWSERILRGGVTDFIFLMPMPECIFNLADVFIDIGYLLVVLDIVCRGMRQAWHTRSQARQSVPPANA